MILNVSRAKDYLNCEAKEHYKHRVGRTPSFVGIALYTGLAWHAGMEALLKTGDVAAGLAAIDEGYADCKPQTERQTKALQHDREILTNLLPAWKKPDDWTVLSVEEPMTLEVGSHQLIGRLDAVVEWNGFLWHLQHKTCGANVGLDIYKRGIQRSFHECLYCRMAEKKYDREVKGTILNLARKLPKVRSLDPDAMAQAINIEYIPISKYNRDKAVRDLAVVAGEIEIRDALHAHGVELDSFQNRDSCTGFYGNSLCPYIEVCDGIGTLTDERYVDYRTLEKYETTYVLQTGSQDDAAKEL